MKKLAIAVVGVIMSFQAASAAIQSKMVEYKDGDVVLEGYLVYDDAVQGKRPGVLVVHEWMGLNDYAQTRAKQLAQLGYVAFAVDMYGKGVRAKDAQEAAALAGQFYKDRELFRSRMRAGLEQLRKFEQADGSKVAAIGYCFGGTAVLELARSGADVAGVVSFHGNPENPNPEGVANVRAKILVLTGGSDPHVPMEQVNLFVDEMTKAGADFQVVVYSGAVHGFTNPANGTDASKPVAYDEKADRRSWEVMKVFFAEVFGEGSREAGMGNREGKE